MNSLPVKYRPKKFGEILGQENIIKILQRQIETNSLRSTYIFSGASGCGKTTTARIFASELGGELIELDAASNNGVDNIRNISEESQERSLSNKYKVYVLDEVHMLSSSAYAALLKLLEEPPKYSIFILCTTDPQKIPSTIISRAQKYNFCKISLNEIIGRLNDICIKENLQYEQNALREIALRSNGSLREAISLLSQVMDFSSSITEENVFNVLEGYGFDFFYNLTNSIIDGDSKKMMSMIDEIDSKGKDLMILLEDYLSFLLNISKYIVFGNIKATIFSPEEENKIKYLINFESPQKYYMYLEDVLSNLKLNSKNISDVKTLLEITLLKIMG